MHHEFIPESGRVKKESYKQVPACLWKVTCLKQLTMYDAKYQVFLHADDPAYHSLLVQ